VRLPLPSPTSHRTRRERPRRRTRKGRPTPKSRQGRPHGAPAGRRPCGIHQNAKADRVQGAHGEELPQVQSKRNRKTGGGRGGGRGRPQLSGNAAPPRSVPTQHTVCECERDDCGLEGLAPKTGLPDEGAYGAYETPWGVPASGCPASCDRGPCRLRLLTTWELQGKGYREDLAVYV